MNLEQDIPSIRSKAQVEKYIRWVGKDAKRFNRIMKFFLMGELDLARKSAWIAGHCVERHPALASRWLKSLLAELKKDGIDDALKRNALRILRFSKIPKALQGMTADICFKMISSLDESIAARAFSIDIILKIAKEEPGLKNELELVIHRMLPYGTAAFRSQAKRMLKKSPARKSPPSKENDWDSIQDWLYQKS